METLLDKFTKNLEAEGKSQDTISQYIGNLQRVDTHMKMQYTKSPIEEPEWFTKEHLNDFLLTLRDLAPPTRNCYISALRAYFAFLADTKYIPDSPAKGLKRVPDKRGPAQKRTRFYPLDEVLAFLDSFSAMGTRYWKRDLAVVALIFGSGLRASEVCRLNISHYQEIKEQGRTTCWRKGGYIAEVFVADFVKDYLSAYLETRGPLTPDDPLFFSQKGGRLTRKALWDSLAKTQRRAGIDTGVHILRHNFLTAIHNDEGIYVASQAGNHHSTKVTKGYIHAGDRVQHAVNHTDYATLFSGIADLVSK